MGKGVNFADWQKMPEGQELLQRPADVRVPRRVRDAPLEHLSASPYSLSSRDKSYYRRPFKRS